MPKLRWTVSAALAAIASATAALALSTAAAHAAPIGPCAEVPFVGVCVPASEQPTPPQQSSGETAFIPDSGSGVRVVG